MNWTTRTCVQCDYFDREFGDCLSRSSDRFQTSAQQPACSSFAKDTGNLTVRQSHTPLVSVDVSVAKSDPFAALRMLGQRLDGVDIDLVHKLRPMHLIGGTHPFDREVERVAGYPCMADAIDESEGGWTD
jgi:hypothetical protein